MRHWMKTFSFFLALSFLACEARGIRGAEVTMGPWHALHDEAVTAVLLVEVERAAGRERRASARVHRSWKTTRLQERLRLPRGFSPDQGVLLLVYLAEPLNAQTESLDRLAGVTQIEESAEEWLTAHLDVGVRHMQAKGADLGGQKWFSGLMDALLDAPTHVVGLVARDLSVGRDPWGRRQVDEWSRWLVVHEHLESPPARTSVVQYLFRELLLRPRLVWPTYRRLLESDPGLRRRLLRGYAVRYRFREWEDEILHSLEEMAMAQEAQPELAMIAAARRTIAEADSQASSVQWVSDWQGILRPTPRAQGGP